jgi:hypothetical protein
VCARCYTTHDRTTFAEIDKNDLVQEEIGCTTNPYLLPPDRRIASRIFLNCGSLLKLCQKNWQGGHTAVSSRGGVATTLFRILLRWSFGAILVSIHYFKALVCGIHKLGVVAAISSDLHNFEFCVVLLAQFWLSFLDQRLSSASSRSFGSILASINYFKALVCGIHKLGVVAAISSDLHNFEFCHRNDGIAPYEL